MKKHIGVVILPRWAPDGMYSANETWSVTWILYVSSKVPTSYRFYTENKVSPYLCYVSPLNFPFLYSASSRNNINPLPILLLWYFFKIKSILLSGAPVCTIYSRCSTHTCHHVNTCMNFSEDTCTYWSILSMLCLFAPLFLHMIKWHI